MADAQEHNLPASQRKIRKAREEGQVARSRDLSHFAAVAAGVGMLAAGAPMLAHSLRDMLQAALHFNAGQVTQGSAMAEQLNRLGSYLAQVVLGIGAVMVLAALAAGVASGGWNFTMAAVRPQFNKINPLEGIGRLFSGHQLMDTLKSCVLALVIGAVGAAYLKNHLNEFSMVLTMPLVAGAAHASELLMQGLVMLLIALAAFAMVDVPLQRFKLMQQLRMSAYEQKQEHKETEGSNEVKARVKQRMRELANRRMLAAVPKADLVVMNPSHFAVALKYDEATMGAPRVVAKGADLMAFRIRDAANDAKVPVLQAPPLARALFAHAELDAEIPAALFGAVAQVLAYVYQLREALAGRMSQVPEMPELDVPAELDPFNLRAAANTGAEA